MDIYLIYINILDRILPDRILDDIRVSLIESSFSKRVRASKCHRDQRALVFFGQFCISISQLVFCCTILYFNFSTFVRGGFEILPEGLRLSIPPLRHSKGLETKQSKNIPRA